MHWGIHFSKAFQIQLSQFVKVSRINLILFLSYLDSSSSNTNSRNVSSNYFNLLTSLIKILTALSSTTINQILATTYDHSKRIKGLSCKLKNSKTRQVWRIDYYKQINSIKQIENSKEIVNNFSKISDLRLRLIKQKQSLKISKKILTKRKKMRFNRILKLTTIRSSQIMILIS